MNRLLSSMFNASKTQEEYSNTPLFLGAEPGLFDTINKQYPKIWDLYKEMKSLDWDANEFDYSQCNIDFKNSPKDVADIMIRTLAWQWEADSVASRSIVAAFAPFVTNSELWAAWGRISDNECYTPDHEVLTPTGWKHIADVTLEDKVAQWKYSTSEVTFVNPISIIKKDYSGEVVSFSAESGNISQVVTPNHRMPVVYPYWKGQSQPEFKLAKDVKYHGGNGFPLSGTLHSGRGMTPQERLYVAVQADGSLCSEKYTGANTGMLHYKFTFHKKRKIARLLELCEQAGWEVRELDVKVDERHKGTRRTFYVYVPVEQFRRDAKDFSWIDFSKISKQWALDFIDEIRHWDGTTTKIGRVRYSSGNKSCIDSVVTIAHLAGYRAHITNIAERTNVLMPNGCYSDTKAAFQVYITPRSYIPGNTVIKEVKEYSGMVYCLSVPSSFFMVRRNGVVSVGGNCVHSTTYSEIVRMSFDNPKEVLGQILSVKESLERLEAVGKIFKELSVKGKQYGLGLIEADQDLYNSIYVAVCTMLILERLQFMASFAITFSIADSGVFQPIGQAVRKICTDELTVHAELDKEIIRIENKTERGVLAKHQTKEQVKKVFLEVIASEIKWSEYLFDGRQLAGVNSDVLKQWVLFNAKDVARFLDIETELEFPKENPMPWLENWIDINKQQAAPQEQDLAQYKVNNTFNDDQEVNFDVDF